MVHHFVMYVKRNLVKNAIIKIWLFPKKIGSNLKQARKDKTLTQKEVANLLKMTQQQYSRFENGIFQLNYEQIIFLCSLYEITPNDLFDLDK